MIERNLGECEILGRKLDENDGEPRSVGEHLSGCEIEFAGGAAGTLRVDLYTSDAGGGYGGMVFKFQIYGDGFIPCARQLPNGAEIHIAGDIETSAALIAIVKALECLDDSFRETEGETIDDNGIQIVKLDR